MAIEAKARARKTEHENRAWLAHQTASLNAFAYHAPKQMPSLESLTAKREAFKPQTPNEMRAAFAAMRKKGR